MSTVHARTLPCKCHRCACEFNTNAEKQAHVRITHVGRRHQCLACASTFANPTRMFAHMLNAHSSQVHVAAGQCGFTINGQLVTSIAQTEVGQAGGKRTEIRRTEVAQVEVAQMKDRQTEVGHTDVAHTEITPNHSENCELTDDGDDENDIKKRTKVKGKYACAECELNFARRSDWGAHMKHLHAVNTPYQCQLCDDRAYGSFAVLRRHCKSKHASYKIATDGTLTLLGDGRGERPALFRCDFCACNFHENYSWKLHMRDQHCILKPYSCKLCDTMFEKISERTEHVRQHHLETITCELCGFVDDDLFVLNQHRAMHLTRLLRGLPIVAVQRNTFKCGRCAKLLRSSSDIRRHMRNAHALNVAFTCRRCDLEFSTFSEKRAHEKKHGTRQHECDQCGKVFARPGRLAEHRALHTAGTPATRNMDTNFVCDICGKSFARKSTLAWHRRIHTDHFKCPYCDLVVHYASRLREHVASRHPGKSYYSCTACARMFVTADTASQHIDVCAGSSIVEALSTNWSQFVCDVCSKVFASKRFLTAHKKVHLAATKRYTCKECPRVYTSAASLREHENVHLGVRPHICDYCEKSFIYRSGLRIHIKRNHKDPICVN
ncbi:zinc finger Y-chromosomal protein 2-like [Tubulanus polymorphus]|uniref:zinc finger Y-chromosomal protein 2-like n=1 Tax=Tubulanus polymorphus TaxID=672921 RepID=UPI003DA4C0FA